MIFPARGYNEQLRLHTANKMSIYNEEGEPRVPSAVSHKPRGYTERRSRPLAATGSVYGNFDYR